MWDRLGCNLCAGDLNDYDGPTGRAKPKQPDYAQPGPPAARSRAETSFPVTLEMHSQKLVALIKKSLHRVRMMRPKRFVPVPPSRTDAAECPQVEVSCISRLPHIQHDTQQHLQTQASVPLGGPARPVWPGRGCELSQRNAVADSASASSSLSLASHSPLAFFSPCLSHMCRSNSEKQAGYPASSTSAPGSPAVLPRINAPNRDRTTKHL